METDKAVSFLTKKGRIDPNNYAEIMDQCELVLIGSNLVEVRRLRRNIDMAVKIVVERYMDWGLAHGVREGARLGVDEIESKSCACMALYRAAFTYVPGNGFANYAPFWIRQLIQKSMDYRMLSTVDSPAGDEDSRETMKDKIAGDSKFEPLTIAENNQMSEIFQRLVGELPEIEQIEVKYWWENDSEITPTVKQFALRMHSAIN